MGLGGLGPIGVWPNIMGPGGRGIFKALAFLRPFLLLWIFHYMMLLDWGL